MAVGWDWPRLGHSHLKVTYSLPGQGWAEGTQRVTGVIYSSPCPGKGPGPSAHVRKRGVGLRAVISQRGLPRPGPRSPLPAAPGGQAEPAQRRGPGGCRRQAASRPMSRIPAPLAQHPHLGQGAVHTTPALHLPSVLTLPTVLSPPLSDW